MSLTLLRRSIFVAVTALTASCEPNVLIGAKLLSDVGSGGQVSVGGSLSVGGAGGGGAGGSGGETGGAATTEGGEAGSTSAGMGGDGGAGGAPPVLEWCATASWLNEPRQFESTSGADNVLPAGSYVVTYAGGAQIHDRNIGYEVTGHYTGSNMVEAGHHIYSGDSPETGSTSLWLTATGLVSGGTIADVEAANAGYTWDLEHAESGELSVVLYDDLYEDNSGPGTRFCITPAL